MNSYDDWYDKETLGGRIRMPETTLFLALGHSIRVAMRKAYNAGLERAAEIADEHEIDIGVYSTDVAEAIRAEIDK